MVRFLFPSTRKGWLLAVLLTVGAGLVYAFADHLGEPKRWILVLMSVGFFAAPISSSRLNVFVWFVVSALIAWAGRYTAVMGPIPLIVLSFIGALLVVRAGERASSYYLPETNGEAIRLPLLMALSLFLVVFVADGFQRSGLLEYGLFARSGRSLLLFLSAASFIRYVLLQWEHAGGKAALPLTRREAEGFVSLQRWPYFIFIALLGWSPLPQWIFNRLGERSERSLHLTAGLLMLFATAIFVAAILRVQRRKDWPRQPIRWASFIAGFFLAHALFAYLVDFGYRSDPLGAGRFSERAAQGIKSVHFFLTTFFLIVLPFVHERTHLLKRYSKLAFFVAPPVLAVMNAPMAAINGNRWDMASTGFLYFVTLVIVGYYAVVTFKETGNGKLYFVFVLTLMLWGGYLDATTADPVNTVYKLFAISTGFVLYALDLFDRAGRS
jgi:hypothetical protein